jgi:hypothetical protein
MFLHEYLKGINHSEDQDIGRGILLKNISAEKGVKVLILVNDLTIILRTKFEKYSGSVKAGSFLTSSVAIKFPIKTL